MRKLYIIIIAVIVLASTACELRLKQFGTDDRESLVEIQRYDRLESRYLTTGDFSALQQMNIEYPTETRTLIEDVLQLGEVNDPEINSKFLRFYQDTTLQAIITATELQYATMCDISKSLSNAFSNLKKVYPDMQLPVVYTQIGALTQSIVVGNNSIGISLDKYLGVDFPIYRRYYPKTQRSQMTRDRIVPDCLCFYLLSLHPLSNFDSRTQYERDIHIAKIQWVVNKLTGTNYFTTKYTSEVNRLVRIKSLTIKQLLES